MTRALKQEVKARLSKTPDNKKTKRRSTIVMQDHHITVEIIPSSQVPSSQVLDCDPLNESVLSVVEYNEVICALCKRGEDEIIVRKCEYCQWNKCIQCEGMVEATEGEENEQIKKIVEFNNSNKREHYQCKQCDEDNENIDTYKLRISVQKNQVNMLERNLKMPLTKMKRC